VPSDTNGFCDVYRRDRVADTMEVVSVDGSGGSANSDSYFPAIDPSGRFVAFTSDATNLVPGDANNGSATYSSGIRRQRRFRRP
jgi:hypothetical protein